MERVLHVVNRMGYGGIETFLMNVYRNIDTEKVQFDFVVSSKEKGEYDEEILSRGGRIFYVPPRRDNIKNYVSAWYDFFHLHQNEFNTVHMHVSSLTDIIPIKIAKKFNIKNRIIHSHNTYQKGILHNILNLIHRLNINKYATMLFACSKDAGKYCFGKKKIEIIHNGIDAKKFEFNIDKRNEMRRILKLKPNTKAFIHVGRFTEQKNHDFLIDIFNEIVKQDNDVKIFLIGSGDKETEIKEKVRKLQLKDYVAFLGLRNDIPDILQAMDCFIFPSLYEGLGIVAIEAQASGLKVFTSDIIPKEVKITKLVQFISLRKSPREWANIILSNIQYERTSTLKEIIKSGYDIISVAKKLEKIYLS